MTDRPLRAARPLPLIRELPARAATSPSPPRSRCGHAPSLLVLLLFLFGAPAVNSTQAQEIGAAEPGKTRGTDESPENMTDGEKAPEDPASADLVQVKQEEALRNLGRLEQAMERLSRLLVRKEPTNAAKLQEAFIFTRQQTIREKMKTILELVEARKFDRATETQKEVEKDLGELLAILLERDVDPRELLKHMRRLRKIIADLDQVVAEETDEKLGSEDADKAGAAAEAIQKDLARLEELIREEKALEKAAAENADAAKKSPEAAAAAKSTLGELESDQGDVRSGTDELLERDKARGERAREATLRATVPPEELPEGGPPGEGKPGEGQPEEGKPGEGKPGEGKPGEGQPGEGKPGEGQPGEGQPGEGKPGEGQPEEGGAPPGGEVPPNQPPPPPPAEPGEVLDHPSLERALRAMDEAREAMATGDLETARKKTSEARAALEEAADRGEKSLEAARLKRNFADLRAEQDATKKRAEEIAKRMERRVPLVSPPEGGVPGKAEVQRASESMGGASRKLGGGKAGRAAQDQQKALDDLTAGREKTEEALDQLSKAFRERLIAYLKERFTSLLAEQKAISRETKSLDLKLRAQRLAAGASEGSELEIELKDRKQSERLARREAKLTEITLDVADLLTEDGTTLVFPEIVQEIEADLRNASGLLERIETGALTQRVQKEIETTVAEILAALEEASKKPPPPNPNQGRESKNGNAPLLPKSSELKMVRALQLRVNRRTIDFELRRDQGAELPPEKKLQVQEIARKQKQVETILRRVARSVGER